ncbi:MarR family winged helix-turn-helix transcriptional regulator [Actibacterium lipolyticum]|uniref:HTH-type transcriptional regulator MhqR n=1 Tax=Actibacterium lipolyticum TaxID=1524263 RepID=A0A238JIY8_9RHOB|nr:MarR family transcriptional regulator [Actibacterium lipolyticum]SMX30640.1 HTH-type transcriptional regulator MhqR [Actibacterium lipolyticum]
MAISASKPATAPQIDDTTLRGFIGYTMKRAYMVVRNDMHRVLAEHDLRVTTFSALCIIAENSDLTQTQLAGALKIERSSVVVVVDELEGRELISRNRVEGDRRTYALRITLKGRRLFERIVEEAKQHENALLSDLSDAERETLFGLLKRVENSAS